MNFTRCLSRVSSVPFPRKWILPHPLSSSRTFAAITRSGNGIPQEVCSFDGRASDVPSLNQDEVHLSFVSSLIGTSDMNIISTGGKYLDGNYLTNTQQQEQTK